MSRLDPSCSSFGLLKYLFPEVGLLPLLRLAQTPDGVCPLADLPDGTTAEYEFWPQWHKPTCLFCEPDVVLRLTLPDGSKRLVPIEAKFQSAKSTDVRDEKQPQPVDQLAREWDNLTFYAQQENAEPVLIYLTADIGCPSGAIEASRVEYRSKRGGESTIAWLSWRHLEALVTGTTDPPLRDLGNMLKKLTLFFFKGFSPVARILPVDWRFTPRTVTYNWHVDLVGPIKWRFVS